MECQSTVVLRAAPASVAAADISASPSQVGWPRFSRDQDHREVCPLSREGMLSVGGLTLYPLDYSAAFAFSLIPPPLSRRPTLARSVPLPPWCTRRGEQQGCHVPPMYPSE